jgi:hypothetical protein
LAVSGIEIDIDELTVDGPVGDPDAFRADIEQAVARQLAGIDLRPVGDTTPIERAARAIVDRIEGGGRQ